MGAHCMIRISSLSLKFKSVHVHFILMLNDIYSTIAFIYIYFIYINIYIYIYDMIVFLH